MTNRQVKMGKNDKNDFAFFLVSTTEWTVDPIFENSHWVSRADQFVCWAQAGRDICRVLVILRPILGGATPGFRQHRIREGGREVKKIK